MSRGRRSRSARICAVASVVSLAAAFTAGPPVLLGAVAGQASATASGSLSAEASPSWQTNSEVRQMAYAGGHIWLVGSFTSMRPPGYAAGQHQTSALYFAALDSSTGALDTAIDHTHTFTNSNYSGADQVYAVAASPDGKTVYVGGNFTAVDGYPRDHVAAFSATTGALLSWSPDVSGKVSAIATAGQSVYLGGAFSTVNSTTRANLADISASTGDLVQPDWAPTTNAAVDALAVTPDDATVVAGGYFDEVNGKTGNGSTTYNKAVILTGAGSSDPGTPLPMSADSAVPPGTSGHPVNGCDSNVKDVVISNGAAYFANEGTGTGCFDGTWAAKLSTGSLIWVNRCLGATQAVAVIGSYLYKGSHAHDCQTNTNHDPANFPQVSPDGARHLLSQKLNNGFLGPWYPNTNAGPDLGPRTMATDGKQLFVGGDFTKVNGAAQQGLARFRTTPDYPTPRPGKPVVKSVQPGHVDVSVTAPVDLDNPTITLKLFASSSKKAVKTKKVTSYFWKQPVVHWVVTGLPQDHKEAFKVRAAATGAPHASKMSAAASVRVACLTAAKIRASLRSVHATRSKTGARRVDLRLCVGAHVAAHLELRKHHQVIVGKSRHLRRGLATVRLGVPKRLHAGRYLVHVVFSRGDKRLVRERTVRVPR